MIIKSKESVGLRKVGVKESTDSVNVGDAFDLLTLTEQSSDLSSELFELLNRNSHTDASVFLREKLHVNLWPEHTRAIVR